LVADNFARAEIIPIIVGQLSLAEQRQLIESLNNILDDQTALVVSVDLSHYHPANQAEQLDRQALDDILNLIVKVFWKTKLMRLGR
jgi:AmmeMemoRadiSam system protein B